MSTATTTTTKTTTTPEAKATATVKDVAKWVKQYDALCDALVAEIVREYETEGARNLRLGESFYNLCRKEADFYGDRYSKSHFTASMTRLRSGITPYLLIDPESIRLDRWLRAYLLRESIRTSSELGEDVASSLSYSELALAATDTRALGFCPKDLSWALRAGWIPFFRDIYNIRARGERITAEEYKDRVDQRQKAIADSRAEHTDPDNADDARNRAAKAAEQKRARLASAQRTKLQEALYDAIQGRAVKPGEVADMIRATAEGLKISVDPASLGVSSKTIGKDDVSRFVEDIAKTNVDGHKILATMIISCARVLVRQGKPGMAAQAIQMATDGTAKAVAKAVRDAESPPTVAIAS